MEVKNLIEYMEIVCGKIMSYPLESNHTDNKYLSQMNSIGKEFILRTSSQSGIKTDKKIPEELCEYIDQYYNFAEIYYRKLIIFLEVLKCRQSLMFQGFPAFLVTEDVLKSP